MDGKTAVNPQIRFSVGLEAPEDLLDDIIAALAACRS